MANTYHQIYMQAVFGVKYRNAVIAPAWRSQLFGVIGTLINDTGCKTILVNGVDDHVHCFFGLKPSLAPADVLKSVKACSSKFVNDSKLTPTRFEWQEGYGVFSYSHSHIDAVFRYIQNQEAHHQKHTFRHEYQTFLEKYNVPYDERFIFDELI